MKTDETESHQGTATVLNKEQWHIIARMELQMGSEIILLLLLGTVIINSQSYVYVNAEALHYHIILCYAW